MTARVSAGRCLLVWTATTAGTALALLVAAPPALDPAGPGFEPALVRGCALALLGCAAWWWLGSTALLVAAVRGREHGLVARLLPAPVRRSVLAACGVAVLAAGPVHAEPGRAPGAGHPDGVTALSGLPLPTRPAGGLSTAVWAGRIAQAVDPAPAGPTTHHVVVAGESLWSIAAGALPRGGSTAAVDDYWRAIHAANRAEIGPDPSLIHPGQRLVLPPIP